MFLLLPAAGMAQQWDEYVNPRFGTIISVPPGYQLTLESKNGDGRIYTSVDGSELLLIWGSQLAGETFDEHYASQIESDKELGWRIDYTAGGKDWRIYSGTKDERIVYSKLLVACNGSLAQHFKFEYPRVAKERLDPVVDVLSSSLKSQKGIDCN